MNGGDGRQEQTICVVLINKRHEGERCPCAAKSHRKARRKKTASAQSKANGDELRGVGHGRMRFY